MCGGGQGGGKAGRGARRSVCPLSPKIRRRRTGERGTQTRGQGGIDPPARIRILRARGCAACNRGKEGAHPSPPFQNTHRPPLGKGAGQAPRLNVGAFSETNPPHGENQPRRREPASPHHQARPRRMRAQSSRSKGRRRILARGGRGEGRGDDLPGWYPE